MRQIVRPFETSKILRYKIQYTYNIIVHTGHTQHSFHISLWFYFNHKSVIFSSLIDRKRMLDRYEIHKLIDGKLHIDSPILLSLINLNVV